MGKYISSGPFNPFAVFKPIQHAIKGIDRPPARCQQRVWVRETVGHDPPALGKRLMGKRRFRFRTSGGFSLRPGFGMEEGSKKRDPIRDTIQRD